MKRRYFLLSLVLILGYGTAAYCQYDDKERALVDKLIDAGQYRKAAEVYENTIKLHPETEAFFGFLVPMYLGMDYMEQGKISEGERQFEEALKRYPDKRANILSLFAAAYNQIKMFDKSLSLFEESIELDPNIAWVHYEYSLTLKAKGLYAKAEEQCRIYLDLEPNDYEGWWVLGNILYSEKRYDEAIAAYKKEMPLNPKKNKVFHRITSAYRAKGDYVNTALYAVQAVQEDIKLEPRNWLNSGMNHLIGFIAMAVIAYALVNRQMSKKYRVRQAVLVGVGVVILDVIASIVFPFLKPTVALVTSPLIFVGYILLCRYICNVYWKKSLLMASVYALAGYIIGIVFIIAKLD